MPTYYAGTRLTAQPLRSLIGISAYKGSDQGITSSTTLVSDLALVLALSASTVYRVDALLYYTGAAHTTGDLKLNFTYPAGATSSGVAYVGQTVSGTLAVEQGQVILGGALGFGSNGTLNIMAVELKFTLSVSTTAGNLQLQIAQNTSSATATTVKAGSVMRAVQVSP